MLSDFIINKSYSWGEKASVRFNNGGVLSVPWSFGVGEYVIIDHNKIKASWNGFVHMLTFNSDYTQCTSVRQSDNNTGVHNLTKLTSTIPSVDVDYKNMSTDLCFLGKKYNVDKSSQRDNPGPNDGNHCHPYSLVYHALFSKNRNDKLNFCEIGIAEGRSLLMWNEYFPNAEIYGFEKMKRFLDNWSTNYSKIPRTHVNYMDVQVEKDLIGPLKNAGVQFDCIIDDSTHFFYDMIRIIYKSREFLKPGGMLIIEDIRKGFDEQWFYDELKDILNEFQTYFFVSLEHNRRNSGNVNNDKMLILVKKGTPIFNCSLF